MYKMLLFCILLFKDLLEDVLEAAIVGLEDGVLGTHVQGPLLLDGILEAAVSKSCDGLFKENVKKQSLHNLTLPDGLFVV